MNKESGNKDRQLFLTRVKPADFGYVLSSETLSKNVKSLTSQESLRLIDPTRLTPQLTGEQVKAYQKDIKLQERNLGDDFGVGEMEKINLHMFLHFYLSLMLDMNLFNSKFEHCFKAL